MLLKDQKWVGSFFRALATVAVPFALLMLTAFALFQWPTSNSSLSEPAPLNFQVIEDPTNAYSASDAILIIAKTKTTNTFETHLSERPFWILLEPPIRGQIVEFPSRHALSLECFSTLTNIQSIGKADRISSIGALRKVKAGFALTATTSLNNPILCKALYKGPAQITALLWDEAKLSQTEDTWQKNSGLLEGGMLTLAVFVLIVAIINKHKAYFIFALWLIFNYRVAAISAGWDFNWLSHEIPQSLLYPIRQLSFAALNILTIVLVVDLFADGLRKIGKRNVVLTLHISSGLMLISAVTLDYSRFLPVMWVLNLIGISIIAYLLTSIIIATRSRVAIWFAASMGVMLLTSMYEIAAASLGLRGLIGTINSVTASLASSLLAALAIAEHLRKARSDHVKTYRVSPVGLATISEDGSLLRTNQSFAMLAGTRALPQDAHWSDYFPPEVLVSIRDELRGEDGPVDIVFSQSNSGAQGDFELWYELTAIKADDGNVETALTDITERKLSTDRLHWLADHDPLTGLLNRRGLNTALSEAMTALSHGRKVALAYIDLNRFKLANDLYGHSTGDQLLKQVTSRLSQHLMSGETIARVGGDEFVIVFLDMQLARAKRRSEELLEIIANPNYSLGNDGRMIRLSASLGLVEMAEGTSVEDSIAAADEACRSAKRDSGAGMVIYPQESSAFGERLAELRLIKRLDATEDFSRILRLNFQPLLRLSSPFDSLDFEVLLRATDPSGMPIPAYRIINSAEKAGYMQRVDLWVLESTLQFLEAHPQQLGKTGLACVNLSGASLNDESFVANVGACLRNYPTVAKRICFEITEAVALHDLANTRRWIDQQRHEGAKVALDDFGAGYSSFAYLRELPADALKIDGAFVRSLAQHASNHSIVQVMIDLAHNLGMATVAECVEDLSTMSMLWELGADYLQGFALAKPMTAEDLLLGQTSWELISDPRARKLVIDTSGLKPPAPVRLA